MKRFSLTAYTSMPDKYGNSYTALRMFDRLTDKEVSGMVSGSKANVHQIIRFWGDAEGWEKDVDYSEREMPIRVFSNYTKGFVYLGCIPHEIIPKIKKALDM